MKCGNSCKDDKRGGGCCHKSCMATEMGLLKSNKVDKATALASLTAAVGSDSAWTNVSIMMICDRVLNLYISDRNHDLQAVTKAVDECFNPSSPIMIKMANMTDPKQDCDADTNQNGNTAICLKRYFLKNCPKPVSSDDCTAFRTFFECIDKNM